jgi:hypothetical protein
MCYTYLNGIISNAFRYESNNDFSQSSTASQFKIDSTKGWIDIYSVRVYASDLDSGVILNNY